MLAARSICLTLSTCREKRSSNASTEHPSQRAIEDLLVAQPDPQFDENLRKLRTLSREVVEAAKTRYEVDAIIAPGDSRLCAIVAAAGYACRALPLGYADRNGRAFGMHVVTGVLGEEAILRIMRAWEDPFPEGRKAPPLMVTTETSTL